MVRFLTAVHINNIQDRHLVKLHRYIIQFVLFMWVFPGFSNDLSLVDVIFYFRGARTV